MGEHQSSQKPESTSKPIRNFASLGRQSLLSRDPKTGVPRALQIQPINPEAIRDDLMERAKEVTEEHKQEEQ
jgi:hypothetical protein